MLLHQLDLGGGQLDIILQWRSIPSSLGICSEVNAPDRSAKPGETAMLITDQRANFVRQRLQQHQPKH